ncbi:MAG: hypothetical protein ACRCYO_11050, partial [Bacteroidia bacterium]
AYQFGVIALTCLQGKNIGDSFSKAFEFSKMYFPNYIAQKDLVAKIEILKSLGLFIHLNQNIYDESLKRVSDEPFLLVSDALKFFPNLIYTRSWYDKSGVISYSTFVRDLSTITHGEFRPKRIKDNASKMRTQKQPIALSFNYGDLKFKETFNDWLYGMEEVKFQTFLNASLKQVGAKGKFYYVETSDEDMSASSFIYLTDVQYQQIAAQNILPLRDGRAPSQK